MSERLEHQRLLVRRAHHHRLHPAQTQLHRAYGGRQRHSAGQRSNFRPDENALAAHSLG